MNGSKYTINCCSVPLGWNPCARAISTSEAATSDQLIGSAVGLKSLSGLFGEDRAGRDGAAEVDGESVIEGVLGVLGVPVDVEPVKIVGVAAEPVGAVEVPCSSGWTISQCLSYEIIKVLAKCSYVK